jgi:uncharacterized protein
MPEETLRYDKMVEDALRGVVRDALTQTVSHGLYGDHHFYITFRTRHPGTRVPDYMVARHPDEMTIVLQHQFWGLEVNPDWFQVTLSFSGVSERLIIPFAAVTGFADPSAKFGLQFQAIGEDEDGDEDGENPVESFPAAASAPGSARESAPDEADAPQAGGDGNVVTLDAFRKK